MNFVKKSAVERELEHHLGKKRVIEFPGIYLAKHDELVEMDPLNVERLILSLYYGEFWSDLEMALKIVLDKRNDCLLTFPELSKLFSSALSG